MPNGGILWKAIIHDVVIPI